MILKKTIERPITVKKKLTGDDGKSRGFKNEVVGMEAVQVEINIDIDKLLDKAKTQIGNHLYNGKDKATLGYGAIVCRVINKRRL